MIYQILGTISVSFSEVLEHEAKAIPCGSCVSHFSTEIEALNEKDAQEKVYQKVSEWKNQLSARTTSSMMEENSFLSVQIVEKH